MMSRHSTSRKQRAKSLWMKRAIQTCFLLAFSIWVINQLKLFLVNGNTKTDLTSDFFTDMSKSMRNQQLKLTRKTLIIDTEVVSAGNERDGVKERSEESRNKEEEDGSEERAEDWIEDFDNQIFEKANTMNDTSNGVHRTEYMEDGWESSLVNGSENFESLDSSSVSAFDQDEKEDNLDVEVLEENTQ